MIKIIINNKKMLVIAMLVGVSSLYSSMMKVWQIKIDVECLLLDSKEIQLYGLSWNLHRFRDYESHVMDTRCGIVTVVSCRIAGFLLSTTCPQRETAAFVSRRFVFYYFNTTYNLWIFIYTAATFYPYLWWNNIVPKSWTMRWPPLGYLLVLISYSISVTVLS